ncbi:dihydroorotate dehydrogenase [Hippea maritima]|uniref:Dihydroorotate dehydrogenase n=1 Tax=Hippea maritima (strain ATCC 700847 / DSM 10411 / MH2) TaxID=760142 RepID=F2LWV8_HIPMA|nr:dihydroorotate dehydrogenase [Hippea maritima]AEA34142.1 dihydroorotate dehydrogenase family protein [Hippea maritima DSM 10411]
MASSVNLAVKLGNLIFKNPVLTASGTFGYGLEYERFLDLNRLGGFVVKGLSVAEKLGNKPPRIVETPCGMLNAIGLQNIGVDRFIEEKLPKMADLNTHIIANIYGTEVAEFVEIAEKLDKEKLVSAIEVNVSCPNVSAGGALFGKDPDMVFVLTSSIKKVTKKPVIVKLTPNVEDIAFIAQAAQSGGADAVSLINTITGMVIDTKTKKPVLANKTGGLSGPAIYPVGVRMVYETYKKIKIPIVGVGGIYNADVALQYIMAGASLIQVGTANFIDPSITVDIIKGIEEFLANEGIESVSSLIGVAHSE